MTIRSIFIFILTCVNLVFADTLVQEYRNSASIEIKIQLSHKLLDEKPDNLDNAEIKGIILSELKHDNAVIRRNFSGLLYRISYINLAGKYHKNKDFFLFDLDNQLKEALNTCLIDTDEIVRKNAVNTIALNYREFDIKNIFIDQYFKEPSEEIKKDILKCLVLTKCDSVEMGRVLADALDYENSEHFGFAAKGVVVLNLISTDVATKLVRKIDCINDRFAYNHIIQAIKINKTQIEPSQIAFLKSFYDSLGSNQDKEALKSLIEYLEN